MLYRTTRGSQSKRTLTLKKKCRPILKITSCIKMAQLCSSTTSKYVVYVHNQGYLSAAGYPSRRGAASLNHFDVLTTLIQSNQNFFISELNKSGAKSTTLLTKTKRFSMRWILRKCRIFKTRFIKNIKFANIC